jgi:hypothetical protein
LLRALKLDGSALLVALISTAFGVLLGQRGRLFKRVSDAQVERGQRGPGGGR